MNWDPDDEASDENRHEERHQQIGRLWQAAPENVNRRENQKNHKKAEIDMLNHWRFHLTRSWCLIVQPSSHH